MFNHYKVLFNVLMIVLLFPFILISILLSSSITHLNSILSRISLLLMMLLYLCQIHCSHMIISRSIINECAGLLIYAASQSSLIHLMLNYIIYLIIISCYPFCVLMTIYLAINLIMLYILYSIQNNPQLSIIPNSVSICLSHLMHYNSISISISITMIITHIFYILGMISISIYSISNTTLISSLSIFIKFITYSLTPISTHSLTQMSSLTSPINSTSQSAIIPNFISFAIIPVLLIHNNESIHQFILSSIPLIYTFTTQTLELVEFTQSIFNY